MSVPRVLIVDDSALVRRALADVLLAAGIPAATASDPVAARSRIAASRPDVIVLDLDMPREDGLTFLRHLMATDPIPVVVCSTHTSVGSRAAFDALREGAVDVVSKPSLAGLAAEAAGLVVDAVRGAARARLRRPIARAVVSERACAAGRPTATPVAIAASTGGPQAVLELLAGLPGDTPGIAIVQHMPAGFTAGFARYLDEHCGIAVREAADGDVLRDGLALVAPGGRHLVVHRSRGGFVAGVADGPPVSRHRPSADVLFSSLAAAAGARALGVILTGMGDDGAAGLLALRRAGGRTAAQDEASSVVYGMPRAALERGAAAAALPLGEIADAVARHGREATVPRCAPPV